MPSQSSASAVGPEPGIDETAAHRVPAPRPALRLLTADTAARAVDVDQAPPGAYLLVGDGPIERLLPLDGPLTYVGRGARADVRFEDPSVSARHAIIVRRAAQHVLLDDRSTNGTFVNARRVVDPVELSDGDVIVFGGVFVTYVVRPG